MELWCCIKGHKPSSYCVTDFSKNSEQQIKEMPRESSILRNCKNNLDNVNK